MVIIRLERMQAKQLQVASLFVSYDNWQSSRGINANSLYGEAYHQMFMLEIKENIQILNGNNHFCRMKQTSYLEIFMKEIKRPTLGPRNIMNLRSYIENVWYRISNDATT